MYSLLAFGLGLLVLGLFILARGELDIRRRVTHKSTLSMYNGLVDSHPVGARLFTSLLYLAVISAAEVITVFLNLRVGLVAHSLVILGLLAKGGLSDHPDTRRFTLALVFAPLIRLISFALPLAEFDLIYWYPATAIPVVAAAVIAMPLLGVSRQDIGLRLAVGPRQALVASSGVVLGVIEYFILSPEPLASELSWGAIWAPALTLLLATGVVEEVVFRGLMQYTSKQFLGPVGVVYVAGIFSVLHLGYRSTWDLVFVFFVGLFFGWVVAKTGSLVGVTLAHGITNIVLFLIAPFILPSPSQVVVSEIVVDFAIPPAVRLISDTPVGLSPEFTPPPQPSLMPTTPPPAPDHTATPTQPSTPTPILTPTFTLTPTPEALVNMRSNLREGPSVVFGVIDTLSPGEPLYILGRDVQGEWVFVRTTTTGREGWIAVLHSTGEGAPQAVRLFEGPLDISRIPIASYIPPVPRGAQPPASVTTTERFPVYFCQYIGDGTWEWYEVEVTYVDGEPVDEEIVEGPFTGPWRGGCPPPPTGPTNTPAPPPPTEEPSGEASLASS